MTSGEGPLDLPTHLDRWTFCGSDSLEFDRLIEALGRLNGK